MEGGQGIRALQSASKALPASLVLAAHNAAGQARDVAGQKANGGGRRAIKRGDRDLRHVCAVLATGARLIWLCAGAGAPLASHDALRQPVNR